MEAHQRFLHSRKIWRQQGNLAIDWLSTDKDLLVWNNFVNRIASSSFSPWTSKVNLCAGVCVPHVNAERWQSVLNSVLSEKRFDDIPL